VNRRAFNRLASAALLGRSGFDAIAETFDYPWKLGIITDQVDFDLGRALQTFFPQYRLHWAEIRYLELSGKKKYVYADTTAGELKEIRRAADTAHTLGTDRIRIFTFRRVADPATIFNRVVEQLQTAIEVARRHDVTLLVENEYDCNIGTGDETARLFKAIPDRRLMHNWDPCNAYEMGEQPFPKVWQQLDHSRISHIHLKDAAGTEWKPIGAGQIDFAGQFKALKAMGYKGTMSVETRYRDARQDQYNSSVESMNGLLSILKS
jgi:sugar phosphate isomerase/epimerase